MCKESHKAGRVCTQRVGGIAGTAHQLGGLVSVTVCGDANTASKPSTLSCTVVWESLLIKPSELPNADASTVTLQYAM